MSKAPSFQFYAQDFLTGVMYLTNEEIGIYIKMLAKQWTDGKIPKKRLGFLVGLEWENFSEELKEKFEDTGEYLINTRLERERDKKERFLEKQSINGKKGGRPSKKELSKKPKQNPNESQKKPLEDEYEKEKEKEVVVEYSFGKSENLLKNDDEFLNKVCSFFSQTTEVLKMRVHSLLNHQITNNTFDQFKEQTLAYIEYKKLSGEQVHRWTSYTAEWDKHDWINMLKNTKSIEVKKEKVNAGTLLKQKYGIS